MRPALLRISFALLCFFYFSRSVDGQNYFNTGLNGTVINLPCNQNCVNVPVRIPHLKFTSDYILDTIAYNPFPFTSTTGTELTTIYQDDQFSQLISLPFTFCFYDSSYTKAVVGSNGVVTFDETDASINPPASVCGNSWQQSQPIPFAGGTQCGTATTYYPKASIMGNFTDLDPRSSASPADRKIEWRIEGTAPGRRFIASYYHVGVFGANGCALTTPTTFQMIMYESTGIIEIYIENKSCVATSNPNGDKSILGIQNWARDKAIAAPGKNATIWSEQHTGYRFVPSGGTSRFIRCEVYTIGGTTPLAIGDTTTTTPGLLDVTFPTFCPPGNSGQYVIKTIFTACDNPANQLESYDTITINKTSSLNATADPVTPTSCGVSGSGSATISVPAGIGTAPYTFVLNPVGTTLTGTSPQQFSGLTAGTYTVHVTDAAGSCASDVPVVITSTGVLAVNFSVVNTSCYGDSVRDGALHITPPNGTPPITYTLIHPLTPVLNLTQVNNGDFNNLYSGDYFLSVHDNAGCQANNVPFTILPGPSITINYTTSPTSCPGANNGSITITGSNGTPPVLYSINGGPYQPVTTFNNLSATTYYFSVIDSKKCQINFFPITVDAGSGTVTGTATPTATTCAGVNDGKIKVTPTSGSGPYEYSINNGTTWQTNDTFIGLAPGTYTILIREGGMCMSSPLSVTITAGSGLQGSITQTSTTCTGANNGKVTVTMSSGSAPYTFVMDGTVTQTSGTNSTTFNNVSAGSHSVTVTDANGCITTSALTVTVAAGAGYTASFTPVPTGCAGVNNGSLIIAPQVPATGPYTVVVNPGAITQASPTSPITIPGLAAGTYTALITDANGCQATINNMTITAGAGLVATPSPTNTSCAGVNNGTIVLTMGSGAAPYTAIMDGTVTQTSATNIILFVGVAAGPHSITVTDANGCITTSPVTTTVAAGTGYTASFAPTPTTCAGVNNGKLVLTAQSPGTAPFTALLNPGAITQTSTTQIITFNGLAPGTYSAVITDANGCQTTLNNMSVTAGAGLIGTTAPTATTCAGVNNGTIVLTMGSGAAPFTAIMDGTVTQTSATNIISFVGVAAGPHSITVTDANGCITTSPVTTTVSAGTGYTASFTPTPTTCAGVNNGKLVLTAQSPGTAPFTALLNPGAITQTSATQIITFNGLAPGNYSAVITDANGCQTTLNNMSVTAGAGLVGTTTPTATTCAGVNNGSIALTMGSGTAPFTAIMDGTVTQTSATNIISFAGVAAGPHSITVTDANGCVTSSPVTSTVPAGTGFTASFAPTPATCAGVNNGKLVLTAQSPGTAPFTALLNPGAITQTSATQIITFNGLAPGNYSAVITDANGCQFTINTMAVTSPSQLQASTSQQSVLCNSASNGKIIVAANGGTTPYQYSLNGGTFQPGNVFNVPAGTYTIDVKDANGCVTPSITNINITEPAVLTASAPLITNATCDGGNDGTINVTAAGGTAPYQFALTGGTYQAANYFNVAPGTYDVSVTDVNGCSYPITGVVVGLTNNLTYTPMVDPAPVCESSSVQLKLVTNATQFAWTGAGLSSNTVADPMATPAGPTLYTITATLGRCTITDDVFVPIYAAPKPDAGPPGDICYGKTYQLQGSGGVLYTWSPSSYLSSTTVPDPVVTPDKTITYTLNVTDANGCNSIVPGIVTVKVTPPIKVLVYPADTIVYAGAKIPLLATSAGTDYTWSTANGITGLDNPYVPNPVATAPLLDGSVVVYKVVATTSAGCQGNAFARIQVYKGPDLYMITGFTPNGDGKNDLFVPFPVGIKEIKYFRVVNRWGQLVYFTNELNKGWDGTFRGAEQPSGVYVWMVQGVTKDNQLITKKGTVTLIR